MVLEINQEIDEQTLAVLKTFHISIKWLSMYRYAQKYYEKYGNLNVPYKFKTNDGIIYDENGVINLGAWIIKQRQRWRPQNIQWQLLDNIGMIWHVHNNWIKVSNISSKYNINIEINENILRHISYQELLAKITFLKNMNMPLCDENGKLQEIFRMCSNEVLDKYGLNTSKIIETYYGNDINKRTLKY